MKLLFLAPQPFFQERGTPIAVRLALQVLTARPVSKKFEIDLLTYNQGQHIDIPGAKLHRIWTPKFLDFFLANVGAGASFKKLVLDFFFFLKLIQLLWINRHSQYTLMHAVEESVFFALLIKLLLRIPYIYDMDSSLALQLTEKWPALKVLNTIFEILEKTAVRHSLAVVPVCDALAAIAIRHGSTKTMVLHDVSLVDNSDTVTEINLRQELPKEARQSKLIVYIGNLESYQGIDLLIDAYKLVTLSDHSSSLVIIGGSKQHLDFYSKKISELGLTQRAILLGPRPLRNLGDYISQSDFLVSPRIQGNNTPMKIYSYMHSGKAIIATNLSTHTQVLDSESAFLAEADVQSFAANILLALSDPKLSKQKGSTAYKIAEERYTFKIFEQRLNQIYDNLLGINF